MVGSLLSISIVPIEQSSENVYSVQVSSRLLKKWNIIQNSTVLLKIGKQEVNVQVQTAMIPISEIHLSSQLLNEFHLPSPGNKFLAKYFPEKNTIQLGPIIGLLTDFHLNDENEPDFRSIHAFCEELHHGIFTSGGFFYVFQLSGFSNKTINGYYFSDGNWRFGELPLPDVIYNRIHSRKLECSETFLSVQQSAANLQIPIFNHRFLSKWEVHNLLMQEEHMHPYLPQTLLFSKESLQFMIERHNSLFIKPIHGSQGRSIIKLTKTSDAYSIESSLLTTQTVLIQNKSLEAVYNYLQQFSKKKLYIIQQGVTLSSLQNRPMDYRVLCHKNEQDLWKVTSLVARISSEKSFVSNLARGGEMMNSYMALSSCFNKETTVEIVELMKELSIETASILSGNAKGLIGELGVDIGIDVTGKLWIIEVNSKPSKNFEDRGQKIRPSAKSILVYCTMLAFKAPSE